MIDDITTVFKIRFPGARSKKRERERPHFGDGDGDGNQYKLVWKESTYAL